MIGAPLAYRIAVEICGNKNKYAPKGSLYFLRATAPRYSRTEFLTEAENVLVERQVSFQIPSFVRWPRYLVANCDKVYDIGDRTFADATAYVIIDAQPLVNPPHRVLVLCQRTALTAEKVR